MNTQYFANRDELKSKKYGDLALHIAQSLWRAMWRGQIIHPLQLKSIYETTLALGIETLPKEDHDGIYAGREGMFPAYQIKEHLTKLDASEPKEGSYE